jgi:hypothetical protein
MQNQKPTSNFPTDASLSQRRRSRRKLIDPSPAGNIIRLPDGRFQLDYVDSNGTRRRPTFATQAEAESTRDHIAAQPPLIWHEIGTDWVCAVLNIFKGLRREARR